MLTARDCALGLRGGEQLRVKRASFVRNGRLDDVHEMKQVKESCLFVGRNDILDMQDPMPRPSIK
jgi:hypothetical protein